MSRKHRYRTSVRLPLDQVEIPHEVMVERIIRFIEKYEGRGPELVQQSARMVAEKASEGEFVRRPRWTMTVKPENFEMWPRPEPGERDPHKRSLDLPAWCRQSLKDLSKDLDVQLGRLLRIAITEMDIEPIVGKPARDRRFLVERIEELEQRLADLGG